MKSWIGLLFLPLLAAGQSSFKFIPDAGIRRDSVSISHAAFENDTFYLYYNDGLMKGLAISTDGLNFTSTNVSSHPRYTAWQMPNGVYRKYYMPQGTVTLKSDSSVNHYNFFPETGIRYELPAADSSFFGVSTYYNDPAGGVYLIYIGGQGPTHFCKSAYSPPGDNGKNFTLRFSNIFSDSVFGGGSYSHVDPFALALPDGGVRVFTMNQHGPPFPPAFPKGYIYSFHSTDGVSFSQDYGVNGDSLRLTYTDFTEFVVYSLNDPKVVLLNDGRYRMYIKALIEVSPGNLKSAIISATTGLISSVGSVHDKPSEPIHVYPVPAQAFLTVEFGSKDQLTKTLVLYNSLGQVVFSVENMEAGYLKIETRHLNSGLYFLEIKSGNQYLYGRKVIIDNG